MSYVLMSVLFTFVHIVSFFVSLPIKVSLISRNSAASWPAQLVRKTEVSSYCIV